MMKLVLTALFLFLALNPSQAKTSVTAQVLDSHKHSVLMSQTRMKSVLVRVVPRAQRRLLITNNQLDIDYETPGPNELDLQGPYRRPKLVETLDCDNSVSDYVAVRLAVARARAIKIYQTKRA